MEHRLCTRDDLQAVVFQSHRFTVDDEGRGLEFISCGDIWPNDPGEYRCENCSDYFEYDSSGVDPWQQALDHLPKQEAA